MGSGGAKQLAISMVIGTTLPTGAAGLIWINTTTAINGWVFSAAEPENPVTGMVWIKTDSVNTNVINLLRKNTVIENVNCVYQYLDASWRRTDSYYHDGVSWTQISYSAMDPANDFSYTGDFTILDDGDGHWRIKFLTSGELTVAGGGLVDLFLLGGGGGTPLGVSGGAGGGYTKTVRNITLSPGTYSIIVGAGGIASSANPGPGNRGGTTSALGYNSEGGYGGNTLGLGGNGGSGGAGSYYSGGSPNNCNGGSDGGNGGAGGNTTTKAGGIGQGTTTREFGEATGALYSYGGRSYIGTVGTAAAATNNTGDGAGSSVAMATGYNGGSGIVILRDMR